MSVSARIVPRPPAKLHCQPKVDLLSGAVHGWVVRGRRVALHEMHAIVRQCEVSQFSIPMDGRALQPAELAEALDRSGLAPDQLELRLPPGDPGRFGTRELLALSAIRDLGVGLALDMLDTSLALARRLPLTALTMSPTLVQTLPFHQHDADLVGAMIQAGQALGLHMAADGIETEAQRECLLRLGCTAGLGRLFGPPRALPNHSFTCEPARSAPALVDDYTFAWRPCGHRGHHLGADRRPRA